MINPRIQDSSNPEITLSRRDLMVRLGPFFGELLMHEQHVRIEDFFQVDEQIAERITSIVRSRRDTSSMGNAEYEEAFFVQTFPYARVASMLYESELNRTHDLSSYNPLLYKMANKSFLYFVNPEENQQVARVAGPQSVSYARLLLRLARDEDYHVDFNTRRLWHNSEIVEHYKTDADLLRSKSFKQLLKIMSSAGQSFWNVPDPHTEAANNETSIIRNARREHEGLSHLFDSKTLGDLDEPLDFRVSESLLAVIALSRRYAKVCPSLLLGYSSIEDLIDSVTSGLGTGTYPRQDLHDFNRYWSGHTTSGCPVRHTRHSAKVINETYSVQDLDRLQKTGILTRNDDGTYEMFDFISASADQMANYLDAIANNLMKLPVE